MTVRKVKYERPWRCRAGVVLTTSNLIGGSTVAIIQSIKNCPPFPDIKGVEFRHCVGFLGYAVTNLGDLWSCRLGRWKKLNPCMNSDGYRQTGLRLNSGGSATKKIATLVAEAFICPRPTGMEVAHEDGTRDNDVPENLNWKTHGENILDAVRHGEYVRVRLGENNANSKLRDADIPLIIEMYKTKTQVAIAAELGVTQTTISLILRKNGIANDIRHFKRHRKQPHL